MIKKVSILITGLLISLTTMQAQTWTQTGQDIEGEAAEDFSGRSVSINSDGSIVAIGAQGNDGNGENSGHVRIYENQNGTWTQIGQDIDGEAAGDLSGIAMDLNSYGSIVAIGAYNNDGNGENSGHTRIYENVNGTWTQIGQDIDGDAAGFGSGSSVSLSDDGIFLAIGTPFSTNNSDLDGHVSIYENQNGTWIQIGQSIIGENAYDRFGISVSLSADGSIVAIGTPHNDENGSTSGHVRIYEKINGTWTQIGQDIDGEAAGDYSGSAISLSADGSIVAIGAHKNSDKGHVRIYENIEETWTQIGQDIDGEAAYDWFGYSLSLSSNGSIVAIGALWNDGNGADAGHVRTYENQDGTWVQLGQDIEGDAADNRLGTSVSISADGLVVATGATHNDGSYNDAGHVKVYTYLTVDIKELSEYGINIYPNPSNGEFNIDVQENYNLQVLDLTGRLIKTQVLDNENNAVEINGSGVYYLRFINENTSFSHKIIVK